MKLSDDEILEILKTGGLSVHKAMDYLYFKSRKKIISHVIKNGGTKEDGQDVLQDTVIAFYSNVLNNKYRKESEIEGYLFGIARNKWLKTLKEKEKLKTIRGIETNYNSTPETTSNQDKYQSLDQVLQKIDEVCRNLLIHAFYLNYSAEEIRKKFNFKNEQVARNKKYKCLKKLRIMITKFKNPMV